MQLRYIKGEMVLYCTYEDRFFPKLLKARWDNHLKGWKLNLSIINYNKVREEAIKNGRELNIDDDLVKFFDSKKMDLNPIDESIDYKTSPYDYQKLMTSLIINKKRCFIFGGVGTGKSKGAIDAVTYLIQKEDLKRVLVITPASIMWNFKNEVEKHSYLDETIIYGSLKNRIEKIQISNTVFDIVNYEILTKLESHLSEKSYDMVILDEIHFCKNRNSNRSKATYNICKNIKYRVGLTGTAITNSYEDLFMLYKIVDPSIFGEHVTKFKERYFITTNWSGYDEVVGYRNEEEIKSLIASNSIKFDIRDVIKDLPPEQNVIKEIHLDKKTMKMYKDMKQDFIIEHEMGEIVAPNILERLLRLSQITSGLLIDTVNNIVDEVSSEKINVLSTILEEITEKCVVFCRFRYSIDRVVGLCEKLGISYYVFDGRTKEKDLYLKFNEDDTKIFIAQIQKSVGYSLQSARYCIFYELDYSRANHIQSRGRILRASGSPHDSIFYIYLLAKGTIDEDIYGILMEKERISQDALSKVKGV